MTRELRPVAALGVIALVGAGCSSSGDTTKTTARGTAVKFAECMRDHGIAEFPDPDASGELTIDAVVNGSSLDTDTPAWKAAIGACRDLQPPGFTGRKRSGQKQTAALRFAQCMRDNGVRDFPDPTADGPIIDTTRIPSAAGRGARSIPGFTAAVAKCREFVARALGEQR